MLAVPMLHFIVKSTFSVGEMTRQIWERSSAVITSGLNTDR